MELFRLREQNPYWEKPEDIGKDFHIKVLSTLPFEIINPVERKIELDKDGIFIIRGPRQIGKTTFLKRSIKKLIESGIDQKRIFYFAFDIGGLKDEREVLDLIKTYLSWIRKKVKEKVWMFLDEVTYTPGWAIGLKIAYDQGLLQEVNIIATGSSSLDLKKGGERLPGRRGEVKEIADLIMLPIDFRTFLELSLKEKLPSLFSFQKEEIYSLAQEVSFYRKEIQEAFDNYLLVGGYPLSINLYFQKSFIENSAYYTYLQAILGDLAKIGKRETFFREITSAIISKKFEPIDWQTIAQSTSIGSHSTVRSYIEDLTYLFVFYVLYPVKTLGATSISFRKRRKVYFLDPFIFHILNSWCAGSFQPFDYASRWLENPDNKAKLVESIVISCLKRKFPLNAFWRNSGEIDFIGFGDKKPKLHLEIKYQNKIVSKNKKSLKKVKGGVLLSKDILYYDKENNILIVPVSYFLALQALEEDQFHY